MGAPACGLRLHDQLIDRQLLLITGAREVLPLLQELGDVGRRAVQSPVDGLGQVRPGAGEHGYRLDPLVLLTRGELPLLQEGIQNGGCAVRQSLVRRAHDGTAAGPQNRQDRDPAVVRQRLLVALDDEGVQVGVGPAQGELCSFTYAGTREIERLQDGDPFVLGPGPGQPRRQKGRQRRIGVGQCLLRLLTYRAAADVPRVDGLGPGIVLRSPVSPIGPGGCRAASRPHDRSGRGSDRQRQKTPTRRTHFGHTASRRATPQHAYPFPPHSCHQT